MGNSYVRLFWGGSGNLAKRVLDGGCGARAYNGGLGRSPQRGPGVEPVVRGLGAKPPPPEAESALDFLCPKEGENLVHFEFSNGVTDPFPIRYP